MAALTLKLPFTGLPQRIISTVAVCQAAEVCEFYSGLSNNSLNVQAMWDTGANTCCITYELAEKLGLYQLDTQKVKSMQGISEAPVFGVDISLPDGTPLASIPITGFTKWGDFDIIIGTDLINKGDFHWTHTDGNSLFTFTLNTENK